MRTRVAMNSRRTFSPPSQAAMVPRPIHPFPARMAAAIPWNELRRSARGPLRVFDPMAGSGTTLVVARSLGHKAIGFDTDPLAVLLARVWCSDVKESLTRRVAEQVHRAARARARGLPLRLAYPFDSDDETRAFVRYWFDATNRRQLASLAREISDIRSTVVRDLLWCAFSRLIITKQAGASLALDVAHSRPHRVLGKNVIRPLDHFLRAVDTVLSTAPFKTADKRNLPAAVEMADARRIPLDSSSVDLVISSPPYLNGIDYLRGHKFSLVWIGHTVGKLRRLRATNIGTEVSTGVALKNPIVVRAMAAMGSLNRLPHRQKRSLARYVADMDNVIKELRRVLVPGGRAVLVVGDSTMRGVYVRNSRSLVYLATHHRFRVVRLRRRRLPPNRRYLPPPSSHDSGPMLQNRLRAETVLELRKR